MPQKECQKSQFGMPMAGAYADRALSAAFLQPIVMQKWHALRSDTVHNLQLAASMSCSLLTLCGTDVRDTRSANQLQSKCHMQQCRRPRCTCEDQ